ncbi:MAG: tRNA pseudouridine13 synthase [Arenicella sp.]|jgi:tRNA pseudouridine13 synthase
MNQPVFIKDSDKDQQNWQLVLDQQAYAYDGPIVVGVIKATPEDFIVTEIMDVEPTGEGEHVWLWIRKTKQNTDQVAKQLARLCGLAYRDVSYSGLKDFFAVTEQWFSVWLPRNDMPDWNTFSMPGVEILKFVRHQRKIKRGTHRANQFSIKITGLKGSQHTLKLEQRLQLIQQQGVPNYFGSQRFGRGARNIEKAQSMFSGEIRVKDRNLRGIFLSAARSWLFNRILSERINNHSWQTLYFGEAANLDGSASVFNAINDLAADSERSLVLENQQSLALQTQRLQDLDIHPTAPMWGDAKPQTFDAYPELHELESAIVADYPQLVNGLIAARIDYQRRPTRMRVRDFSWQIDDQQLHLSFCLSKGQYATSVLRELVSLPEGVAQ